MITLILGGARSGKSKFAEKIAWSWGKEEVYYLATAEGKDEEMQARIEQHQKYRPSSWTTIEEPRKADQALAGLADGSVVLMDCITIYISNLMMEKQEKQKTEQKKYILEKMELLVNSINHKEIKAVLVSNEVGQGIVPSSSMGRTYRDIAGRVNQFLAEKAEEVYLTAAGLPIEIKETGLKNLKKFEEGEK